MSASGVSGSDTYIAKLNPNGAYQWALVMPDGGRNLDIAADDAGNVYVSGQSFFQSTSIDTFQIPSNQDYIFKLNTLGEVQWLKSFPSSNFLEIPEISVDPAGNCIVLGTYPPSTTASFDGFSLPNNPGSFNSSFFFAKIDPAGTTQWVRSLVSQSGSLNGGLFAGDVMTDSIGAVYLAGAFGHDMKLDNTGPDVLVHSGDSLDAFAAKFDFNGNLEWVSTAGGVGDQMIKGLAISHGKIYAIGSINKTSSFGAVNLTATTHVSILLTMSHLGVFLNGLTEGNGFFTDVTDLEADSKGNLIVAGIYDSPASFSGLSLPLSPGPATHGYIANYDTALIINWIAGYGIGTGASYLADVSIIPDGRLYACGSFTSTSSFDNFPLTAGGGGDGYLFCLADSINPIIFPTDSVWPGDTDYDGVANNFDLLPIGLAYGDQGLGRMNQSIAWAGIPALDWNDTLPGGLDNKHIDTNGDSLINVHDTLAIFQNYGLMHNKFDGGSKTGLPIFASFEEDTLFAGDTTDVIIHLGTDTLPADSIYGLAFSIMYDSSLIDAFNISVSYANSWLGTNDVNMLTMERNFPNEEQIDFALTRIDQANVNGYGEIARLTIIMVDDLTAKMPITEVLNLNIVNVYAHDASAQEVDLQPLPASVVLTQDDVSTSLDPFLQSRLTVYPNPANEQLTIELDGVHGYGFTLYNLMGQPLLHRQQLFQNQSVSTATFADGLYVLEARTPLGIISKRVMIRH